MESGQLYKYAKQKVTQRIEKEWKCLARAFEFQDTDIAAIQQSSHTDLHEEIHQLFVKWEKQCCGARCVHELLNALRKAAHDSRKQLITDIAGELLKMIIDNQFVEKTRDRWCEIAEAVGFTSAEIHECVQVDVNDRKAQSDVFLDKWCQKEGWNMLLQLPTALNDAGFKDRADRLAQGVYGMSLASFVSWRDSLFIVPDPTALENGCLVKVKHSGLWLFGVVKDIKTDTHPGVAAVEMEEHYDCLGETLKDGIAHFPMHSLQLDTEFLQRQQSLDLQPTEQLEAPSLMGLVLNDDPPQLEWSSLFPPASSSPGTPQDNISIVKPPHKEQAQGDKFIFESGLPGSSSVHEAGALQLSPVDPEERLSEAGTIPGGQTRMVLGSDGDKDRSGKKLNPKLKYLASFRYGTL